MSLVRLLTAGKSLTDLKNTTSRYQVRPKNMAPRFGLSKNPFGAPSGGSTAPSKKRTQPGPFSPEYELSPEEIAAASMKQTMRLPVLPATGQPTAAPKPVPAATTSSRIGQWARKLNPLAWWSDRKPASRRKGPRGARPVVQAELSLNNIKVVRNELNDADPGTVRRNKYVLKRKARPMTVPGTQPG